MAKTCELGCLKLSSSLWHHVKHLKKNKKAASIKVNETHIKGCQFTLGLKVLKNF